MKTMPFSSIDLADLEVRMNKKLSEDALQLRMKNLPSRLREEQERDLFSFAYGYKRALDDLQDQLELRGAERVPDSLDTQEFYEMMQAYRHSPVTPQSQVVGYFEKVKQFIRVNFQKR